jgi:hypothetical protein
MGVVGFAVWYWRYRFMVALFINTTHTGLTVWMTEAKSAAVVCGPTA